MCLDFKLRNLLVLPNTLYLDKALPSSDVSIILSGFQVAVHVRRFTHPDPLVFDDFLRIGIVRRRLSAICLIVWFLLHLENEARSGRR